MQGQHIQNIGAWEKNTTLPEELRNRQFFSKNGAGLTWNTKKKPTNIQYWNRAFDVERARAVNKDLFPASLDACKERLLKSGIALTYKKHSDFFKGFEWDYEAIRKFLGEPEVNDELVKKLNYRELLSLEHKNKKGLQLLTAVRNHLFPLLYKTSEGRHVFEEYVAKEFHTRETLLVQLVIAVKLGGVLFHSFYDHYEMQINDCAVKSVREEIGGMTSVQQELLYQELKKRFAKKNNVEPTLMMEGGSSKAKPADADKSERLEELDIRNDENIGYEWEEDITLQKCNDGTFPKKHPLECYIYGTLDYLHDKLLLPLSEFKATFKNLKLPRRWWLHIATELNANKKENELIYKEVKLKNESSSYATNAQNETIILENNWVVYDYDEVHNEYALMHYIAYCDSDCNYDTRKYFKRDGFTLCDHIPHNNNDLPMPSQAQRNLNDSVIEETTDTPTNTPMNTQPKRNFNIGCKGNRGLVPLRIRQVQRKEINTVKRKAKTKKRKAKSSYARVKKKRKNEQKTYHPEKIVLKQTVNGKVEYKVFWKDYDSEDEDGYSWEGENAEVFKKNPDLISKFEA